MLTQCHGVPLAGSELVVMYQGLTVLPGVWIVLRVDGRSFSRFPEANFDEPFDESFSVHMVGDYRVWLQRTVLEP